jgi:hypothetical protein
VGGFGDLVGLAARFPAAWYAQPYGATTLLITSFPVHVDDGSVLRAIPAGGTAIQVFDQPSGSIRSCERLGGRHGRMHLGHFEPNYEGFGAAYRNQFHDHGHTVLVFTSFAGHPPTRTQRRLATAILNSIHVDPGACPVKTIIAIGQRATVLNSLLTQARRRAAAIRSRRGAYTPKLSATSGRVGTRVTITGAIPPTRENGQPVHLARLVVWWNLDTGYPSPTVPNSHSRSSRQVDQAHNHPCHHHAVEIPGHLDGAECAPAEIPGCRPSGSQGRKHRPVWISFLQGHRDAVATTRSSSSSCAFNEMRFTRRRQWTLDLAGDRRPAQ